MRVWPLRGWCRWERWGGGGSCCRGKTPRRWERSCGYLRSTGNTHKSSPLSLCGAQTQASFVKLTRSPRLKVNSHVKIKTSQLCKLKDVPVRIKTVLTRALQQEKTGALAVEEITSFCKRKTMIYESLSSLGFISHFCTKQSYVTQIDGRLSGKMCVSVSRNQMSDAGMDSVVEGVQINVWGAELCKKNDLCRCPCTAGRWTRPVAPSAGWEAPARHTHEPTDSENYRGILFYSTLVYGNKKIISLHWGDITWCQYPDRWSRQVKIESETPLEWTTITKNRLSSHSHSIMIFRHHMGIKQW